MSKYAPLGDFLRRQKTTFVPMTFGRCWHMASKVTCTFFPVDGRRHSKVTLR